MKPPFAYSGGKKPSVAVPLLSGLLADAECAADLRPTGPVLAGGIDNVADACVCESRQSGVLTEHAKADLGAAVDRRDGVRDPRRLLVDESPSDSCSCVRHASRVIDAGGERQEVLTNILRQSEQSLTRIGQADNAPAGES